MVDSLRNALALPDLRRRIMFTIGLLVVYRLVANIPVPGVNLASWALFTSRSTGDNAFIDVLNLLSGGAVRNFSVMALGVYPYITASIIMTLLTPLIPQLEELSAEGESGRNQINRYTYYLAIPLGIAQAVGQIQLIGSSVAGGVAGILPNYGLSGDKILFTLTTLLAMLGGTMFAMWLGEQITENGIGQGISLIIFSGIVASVPQNLLGIVTLPDATSRWFSIIAFIVLLVATVLVIVVIQEGQRRIPVQYGRRVRGRKMYQGQSTHVPLKVNTAGMIPIIFAQSLLTLPALVAQFFTSGDGIGSRMAGWIVETFGNQSTFPYWLLYFLFVVGFTFFYTDVMVQQQKIPSTLQRQGGFIPGIRPGKKTADYITSVVRRITLVGAVFLGIVAILPGIMQLLGFLLNLPDIRQSALVISGSGLIIVVGVVIDTMRQLEAQLLMRHYEGVVR